MDNIDQAIKKAIEERDDLINKAEALVDESDGSLEGEKKEQFDSYKKQIDEKDNYIAAKKWQAQERAKQSEPYRNPDDGEKKELSKFSWSEFMMSVHPGMRDDLGDKLGFYKELSQEGKNQMRVIKGLELQGGSSMVIPYNVLKANIKKYRGDVTITTEGGDVTFDQDGGFIDKLLERLVVRSLGADTMTGLTGDVKFPRESNKLTGTWEGETDAGAEETPTYDNVSLSPKRLGLFVDVSNQAILQTNPSIDARIERQMIGGVQRTWEKAAINGSGTAPEPEGILNTTGIGSADVGTNGGAQDWDKWVDNETEVAQDDADIGSLAYLTNAKVRGQAKRTFIDAGSGLRIWQPNDTMVNGYNVGVTNLVPSNLSKGTGTNLSALIFGNFNDLVLPQWGGLEVLVDPFTQATSGMTRMVLNIYVDVGVLRAESFSATQDIDTTA